MATISDALNYVIAEVVHAEKKHPNWPDDMFHGALILAEESGEAMKAVLDLYNGKCGREALMIEVAQTGAMAVRFLRYLMDATSVRG